MTELSLLVPTRGRPHSARSLLSTLEHTITEDTSVCFVVDDDDAELPSYQAAVAEYPDLAGIRVVNDSRNMVYALNEAATSYAPGETFALAFMGDDHRPRTRGWDRAYLNALKDLGTGIVYGNDLLQGERLPTQCAMTSDIVQALGYMVPPELVHMYADNFWLDLGKAIGRIRYLPNVIVEHLHPVVGKALWDEGYRRVNADWVYREDYESYQLYKTLRFAEDVAKVAAL